MGRLAGICAGLLLSIIVAPRLAIAAEVILSNGDRITGKFVRLAEGELVIETDYAGEMTIASEKVRRLTTDDPVTVRLEDGTTSEGSVFLSDETINEDDGRPAVALARIESLTAQPVPPVRIRGNANVGITRERGNTDTAQYRIDAEVIARMEKIRLTIGGEFSREKDDNVTTAANWQGYGLYDYFIKPKWFLYASSLFEHDEFADLNLRTTLGAGGGHQFFESDDLNLSTSTGLAYVFEDYIQADGDRFAAAQWIIRYDQFFFDEAVQLFHLNNGYISLEDASNWLINTRQGLRFPLYKGFLTTLQYNYDYTNKPSTEAASKWDSKLLFLLGYQFGNSP